MNPQDPTPNPASSAAPFPPSEPGTLAAGGWTSSRSPEADMVRRGLAIILLVVLAICAITLVWSLLRIMDIWFEHQYTPIANVAVALGLGAAAVYALRYVLRRA
ncbi:MAG TPA: hypothetical protein VFH47_04680 [Candidatus Thermoplasmatota archaeon]|nr:hypothetical protein [Candidatus Thermoplasmatota archaeon]